MTRSGAAAAEGDARSCALGVTVRCCAARAQPGNLAHQGREPRARACEGGSGRHVAVCDGARGYIYARRRMARMLMRRVITDVSFLGREEEVAVGGSGLWGCITEADDGGGRVRVGEMSDRGE